MSLQQFDQIWLCSDFNFSEKFTFQIGIENMLPKSFFSEGLLWGYYKSVTVFMFLWAGWINFCFSMCNSSIRIKGPNWSFLVILLKVCLCCCRYILFIDIIRLVSIVAFSCFQRLTPCQTIYFVKHSHKHLADFCLSPEPLQEIDSSWRLFFKGDAAAIWGRYCIHRHLSGVSVSALVLWLIVSALAGEKIGS